MIIQGSVQLTALPGQMRPGLLPWRAGLLRHRIQGPTAHGLTTTNAPTFPALRKRAQACVVQVREKLHKNTMLLERLRSCPSAAPYLLRRYTAPLLKYSIDEGGEQESPTGPESLHSILKSAPRCHTLTPPLPPNAPHCIRRKLFKEAEQPHPLVKIEELPKAQALPSLWKRVRSNVAAQAHPSRSWRRDAVAAPLQLVGTTSAAARMRATAAASAAGRASQASAAIVAAAHEEGVPMPQLLGASAAHDNREPSHSDSGIANRSSLPNQSADIICPVCRGRGRKSVHR